MRAPERKSLAEAAGCRAEAKVRRRSYWIIERESCRARALDMFARMVGGFPAIKTLDQYDFNFATSVCNFRTL